MGIKMPLSDNRLDTNKLKSKASVDDLKEYYETIERRLDYKIGMGTRINKQKGPLFFLEVVISFCEGDGELDIGNLRGKLRMLEEFEKMGYSLRCDKDNFIICEKDVLEADIHEEYNKSKNILDRS